MMMWESSTRTRGSAGLVGGRTVTISTLEVTARGVLQGGGTGCHGDGDAARGDSGQPHSPGRGQDQSQRAVQHGPDDEVGRLIRFCRERGRESGAVIQRPAHAWAQRARTHT